MWDDYTPIAFDERVTFLLQHARSLPCGVRLLHCMHVRLRNGYTRAYAQIMQHTHTNKAVTGCVEAKKLLSRRRQSNYRVPDQLPLWLQQSLINGISCNGISWVTVVSEHL